jgi:hypothetical protein
MQMIKAGNGRGNSEDGAYWKVQVKPLWTLLTISRHRVDHRDINSMLKQIK